MAVGYVIVNVYTSRSQIPIKNAFVSVTTGTSPNTNLLGFRTTDENGASGIISIETPSLELSLTPTDVKPFTSFDIRVSHPLYYTMIINDVQVFANTKTIQNVELIPLTENSEPQNRTITNTIPQQNL